MGQSRRVKNPGGGEFFDVGKLLLWRLRGTREARSDASRLLLEGHLEAMANIAMGSLPR